MAETYPLTYRARMAIRHERYRAATEQAACEAASLGRSPKCRSVTRPGQHAGMPDGCTNDGTTCLCACHDQPGGQVDPEIVDDDLPPLPPKWSAPLTPARTFIAALEAETVALAQALDAIAHEYSPHAPGKPCEDSDIYGETCSLGQEEPVHHTAARVRADLEATQDGTDG